MRAYANSSPPQHKGAKDNESRNEVRTDLTTSVYLDWVRQWVWDGATLIGGCCGIGPEHIADLCKKLT
ncbi:homocysteine S-methyltransferase family protein [Desulforhopalus sp. 52FAK]